ncbi:hypothetical protein AAVH_35088, partial [Aphelenchoides avenae]
PRFFCGSAVLRCVDGERCDANIVAGSVLIAAAAVAPEVAAAAMWDSTTFHVLLSLFLHVTGVCTGLWIWYLFPKNPVKNVTRLPIERRSLLCDDDDERTDLGSGKSLRHLG